LRDQRLRREAAHGFDYVAPVALCQRRVREGRRAHIFHDGSAVEADLRAAQTQGLHQRLDRTQELASRQRHRETRLAGGDDSAGDTRRQVML
jgi:hypothetical protein